MKSITSLANSRNLFPRLFFLILAIIPFIYFKQFSQHFYTYLTGNVITTVITQQWHIVLISALMFLAFLLPLSYRRKANWVEYGLVSAFFISLFVEMYGIPLTILLASNFFTNSMQLPTNVIYFNFLGINFAMDLAMAYSSILITIGAAFVVIGWITLYRNIKNERLITRGIYSLSRHPQYLGFILIILGWFVGWPTILTLVFAPILIYKYVQTSKAEEKEVSSESDYEKYKDQTPFFI